MGRYLKGKTSQEQDVPKDRYLKKETARERSQEEDMSQKDISKGYQFYLRLSIDKVQR